MSSRTFEWRNRVGSERINRTAKKIALEMKLKEKK